MENSSLLKQNKSGTIFLKDRTEVELTGITKIYSIKQDLAQLESELGTVSITGTNIELKNFNIDKKELSLMGNFSSIRYMDSKPPLFRKLFKWYLQIFIVFTTCWFLYF